MIKQPLLLLVMAMFAQPAYAALVINVSSNPIRVNSGFKTVDIRIWRTSDDLLLAFAGDFTISGPSAVTLAVPAGDFGLAGMVGHNNLASGSFENAANVAILSLDFNAEEAVAMSAPGNLLAQLRLDTLNLVAGQYVVSLDNAFAVNEGGEFVSVSGGGGFSVVPEPSSLAMLGLCAAGCLIRRRKPSLSARQTTFASDSSTPIQS